MRVGGLEKRAGTIEISIFGSGTSFARIWSAMRYTSSHVCLLAWGCGEQWHQPPRSPFLLSMPNVALCHHLRSQFSARSFKSTSTNTHLPPSYSGCKTLSRFCHASRNSHRPAPSLTSSARHSPPSCTRQLLHAGTHEQKQPAFPHVSTSHAGTLQLLGDFPNGFPSGPTIS